MKTGDLIRALAADSEVRAIPPGRALALALIPGVAITLGLHFAILGLRPHLFALLGEPRLLFKLCLAVLLIALTRIYVGAHYVTDVIGAIAAGLVWLIWSQIGVALVRRNAKTARSSA